jgi:cytoskeletal protein RodZ
MAKRSGSKTSRSDRRAGKERARRAREHGLPERREEARRARASTPEPGSRDDGEDRSSDAPRMAKAKSPGVPTLVKVIGGALVILLGVYIFSQRREDALTETKPAPELPSAQASATVESPTTAVPAPEPEPEPKTAPAPERVVAPTPSAGPAAVVSVTPPSKPVVVIPLVSAPSKPKVEKPVVAPAPAVPKPAAPKPAEKPADNPY